MQVWWQRLGIKRRARLAGRRTASSRDRRALDLWKDREEGLWQNRRKTPWWNALKPIPVLQIYIYIEQSGNTWNHVSVHILCSSAPGSGNSASKNNTKEGKLRSIKCVTNVYLCLVWDFERRVKRIMCGRYTWSFVFEEHKRICSNLGKRLWFQNVENMQNLV